MEEPLSAILAEMKRRADEAHDGLNGVADTNQIDYMEVEDWDDRIEAAVKRQIRAERTEAIDEALAHAEEVRAEKCRNCERAPGNAAALREALERLASIDIDEDIWDDEGADGRKLHNAVIDARAALSAPARNCDVSRDTKETIERCLESLNVESSSASFDAGVCAAIGWLFAEAEGGAE